MTIKDALVVLVMNLAPCAAGAASSSLQLIDLTHEFDRVWASTESQPAAARLAEFKATFSKVLPGFYDYKRSGFESEAAYDEEVLKAFQRYPGQRNGILKMSRDFEAAFQPALRSFEEKFGKMTGYPPVYLIHSLGEFDGGTRTLPEGTRLMFGADVMHRIYNDISPRPFFHHELFHLMHGRIFPECKPVWCALWTEGLAVYVSSELNPGATDAELLLTWPSPLRPAVEANRKTAVCELRRQLDSTDPREYAALFSNGAPPHGLPARYGYYLGYLVAAEAGRDRSLKSLASLAGVDVRRLVEETLDRLASCS